MNYGKDNLVCEANNNNDNFLLVGNKNDD